MIGRMIALRDARPTAAARAGQVALFAAALVVLLPLRLVAGLVPGLSAQAVSGSIWAGHLRDAAFGPFALGDLDARLDPLRLLLGRVEVNLAGEGMAARLGHSGVADATGTVRTNAGLGTLPVEAVTFEGFSALFRDGACDKVQGRITVTVALSGASSLALSGEPRCAGAGLLLPLRGPGGMERLDIRIAGDGRWRADLSVAGLSAEAAAPLRAAGFSARPDGLGLTTGGRF